MSELIIFYRNLNQKIKVMSFNEGLYEELSEFSSGYAHYSIDIINAERSIDAPPENILHIIEECEVEYTHYFAVLNTSARIMVHRSIGKGIDLYSCIERAITKVCAEIEHEICD